MIFSPIPECYHGGASKGSNNAGRKGVAVLVLRHVEAVVVDWADF